MTDSSRYVQVPIPAVQVVQKTIRDPQAHFNNTVVDVLVVVQHQAPMVQEAHIQVFKGERAVTKDNNLQCKFHCDGTSPAPCCASQFEVTFDTHMANMANASLNVSAQDRSIGRSDQITMTSEKEHLSPTEIDHLVQEPEVYRDEGEIYKSKVPFTIYR